MSPRLPSISGKALVKIVEARGFVFLRQSGSHAIFGHTDGRRTTIPIHSNRDRGRGLLRQIMRDVDLSVDDLIE
jgi:predicted RNA binding protein YcfA (HicA-like mRNA interferase family)